MCADLDHSPHHAGSKERGSASTVSTKNVAGPTEFDIALHFLQRFNKEFEVCKLDSAITGLAAAVLAQNPVDAEYTKCIDQLVSTLLARFLFGAREQDVQCAYHLRIEPSSRNLDIFKHCTKNITAQEAKNTMANVMCMLDQCFHARNHAMLDNVLLRCRRELKTPSSRWPQWQILWELSQVLLLRFYCTRCARTDLVDEAVSHLETVAKSMPCRLLSLVAARLATTHTHDMQPLRMIMQSVDDNSDNGIRIGVRGQDLLNRFHSDYDFEHLKGAVTQFRNAVSLLSLWNARFRPTLVNQLSIALRELFQHQGNLSDLNEAIDVLNESLEVLSAQKAECSSCLVTLGSAHFRRFEATGNLYDLNRGIICLQKVLAANHGQNTTRTASLVNLSVMLQARFTHLGNSKDLDYAIDFAKQFPQSEGNQALSVHGQALYTRHLHHGDPADLEEAIRLHREALEQCPQRDPARVDCLNDLALARRKQFERTGELSGITEVIELLREAKELCAGARSDIGTIDINLADSLSLRFHHSRTRKDNEEAIVLLEDVLRSNPSTNSKRSGALKSLAAARHARFEELGNEVENDKAIKLYRQALDLHGDSHPYRDECLDGLALAVRSRFEQRGDLEDIDQVVKLHREALKLRAVPHPHRVVSLCHLAGALRTQSRSLHGRSVENTEAITLLREAEALIRDIPNHPDYIWCLSNLASAIGAANNNTAEAIELLRKALNACPLNHPKRPELLNNIAILLIRQNSSGQNHNELEEAIRFCEEALHACPAPHPLRPSILENRADGLLALPPDKRPFKEAIEVLREATEYRDTPVLDRFPLSVKWAIVASSHDDESAIDAYRESTSVLPQIAAFDLNLNSRQELLARVREYISILVSGSAAYAVKKKEYGSAVEFLEASRSVFWARALQLRTPLDKLESAKDPHGRELATKLKDISRRLEQGGFRDKGAWRQLNDREIRRQWRLADEEQTQLRELARDWEDTVKSIRSLDGFNDFLCSKTADSLKDAAVSGPVVILGTDPWGAASYALIVSSSQGDPMRVQHVELARFDHATAQMYGRLLRTAAKEGSVDINHVDPTWPASRGDGSNPSHSSVSGSRLFVTRENAKYKTLDEILEELLPKLWKDVAKPIVDTLELEKSTKPPRLWWCSTGPFSFLPIHAAGEYTNEGTDCVSQYATSSYTPTLTALLNRPSDDKDVFQMTAVVEPNAPGCSTLPWASREGDLIKGIIQRISGTCPTILKNTNKEEVLQRLQTSSICHFACHGIQDVYDPLSSGLVLTGGRLSMREIMRGMVSNNGDRGIGRSHRLAFLAACETAHGDRNNPDEALHLAGSLLFAGFHGVIGTLWTINDEDGPKVAGPFYEHLFQNSRGDSEVQPPNLSDAAQALQVAVDELRRQGASFKRWVPFAHYGL
ncbi:CHAT domain-containing protein [Mycena sanguinolenta]|nr:CHAT domain-containing protein [Mycena sanguinolenta]